MLNFYAKELYYACVYLLKVSFQGKLVVEVMLCEKMETNMFLITLLGLDMVMVV